MTQQVVCMNDTFIGCLTHYHHAGLRACAGSGLSSSAAIVCASALAVLGYYGVPVAKWVSAHVHACTPCLTVLLTLPQALASPAHLPWSVLLLWLTLQPTRYGSP